jgi:hypothetical protein
LRTGLLDATSLSMHRMAKRIVYIIRSDTDPSRHYVGITNNLRNRLEWHNNGPTGHTVANRPWSRSSFRPKRRRCALRTTSNPAQAARSPSDTSHHVAKHDKKPLRQAALVAARHVSSSAHSPVSQPAFAHVNTSELRLGKPSPITAMRLKGRARYGENRECGGTHGWRRGWRISCFLLRRPPFYVGIYTSADRVTHEASGRRDSPFRRNSP